MLADSGTITIPSFESWQLGQGLLLFCCLITTVSLDGPDTGADVFGIIGTVLRADSSSFGVLLFDICQLKQLLLLSAA